MPLHISVTYRKKRRYSVSLRVGENGSLVLSIPTKFPILQIAAFLSDHTKFLAKALKHVSRQHLPEVLTTGTDLKILGRTYLLEVATSSRASLVFNHDAQTLSGQAKNGLLPRKKFYDLAAKELSRIALPLAEKWGPIVSNRPYKAIRFKLTRSLWGSCSSTGNITLNKRLIHCPLAVVEYVVIHELVHLREANHSERFWNIVKEFCPEYQSLRKVLRSRIYG